LDEELEDLIFDFIDSAYFTKENRLVIQKEILGEKIVDLISRKRQNENGEIVGPYEFRRTVDIAGEAAVLLIWDTILDAPRCLKIARHDLPMVTHERFKRSVKTLHSLDSVYIPKVIEFSKQPLWCILEWFDGKNLLDFVSSPEYTKEKGLKIFIQTCEALRYLHQHNVIHRDIKPRNIMVKKNLQVKLVDFGYAKDLGRDLNLTAAGQPIGNKMYSPDEQLKGEQATEKSDVAALGKIFYFLVTSGNELWKPELLEPQDVILYKRCTEKNPKKRADIGEVIALFLEAYPVMDRRSGEKGSGGLGLDYWDALNYVYVRLKWSKTRFSYWTGIPKREIDQELTWLLERLSC